MLKCFQNKLIKIMEVQFLVFFLNLGEVVPNFTIKKEGTFYFASKFNKS